MPEDQPDKTEQGGSAPRYSLLAAAAVCLPLLALAVSASVFPTSVWFRVFSVAVLFAVQFFVIVYLISGPSAFGIESEDGKDAGGQGSLFGPETEEMLQVLEEAGNLLGGSLRLKDMFRLIASKAGEIVPLEGQTLLILRSETREPRELVSGDVPAPLPKAARELAAEAERKRSSVILAGDQNKDSRWGAMPLSKGGNVFGVIAGRLADSTKSDRELRILLDAIAERVSPVIFAALSFDEREATALVDVLTGLPNARAFELVLANRVAEAQRARGGAKLMVLAMDVKDFSSINSRFGHGTGDRLLAFSAEVIRDQLRKMDLVARTGADEFLAVLPAAGSATAEAVIERIKSAFGNRKFELPNGETAVIEINFGSAVYGNNAEDVPELIASARADRDGTKPGKSNQVIRFPTKHSN